MQLREHRTFFLSAGAMGITGFLLFCGALLFGMIPFGTADFVVWDARIQYIDLFTWFQRLLRGEDSFTWSFFCGLGSNVWPIFSYYLASPWNLFVLLFQQKDLYLFYDILVYWKMSLASACMAIYLSQRFQQRIPAVFTLLLAVAYGMSEYGMDFARNVMWLDGFYLLPLILLGVWRAGTRQGSACLILASACAMIFNWYTGCIDLLFAGFFALWESWLACGEYFHWRKWGGFFLRVLCGILLGVGISAFLFVPSLIGMEGGRAGIDWNVLDGRFNGNVASLLSSQSWGTFSVDKKASVFVGAFSFLGAWSFFLNSAIARRLRLGALALLVFILLMFYWHPLFFLFSLLKEIQGYWYRYSYAAIFLLIYLAGWNAAVYSGMEKFRKKWLLLFIAVPMAVCVASRLEPVRNLHWVLAGIVLYLLSATAVFFHLHLAGRKRHLALALAAVVSLLDLLGNFGAFVKDGYAQGTAAGYAAYQAGQRVQLDALAQRTGQGVFRISQTTPFNMDELRRTANYNEGLAYGIMTLASYTSGPVNSQMAFLDAFGYRQNGPNMNIVDTSVLGTDSLLGVRYVLTDRPIQGLEYIGEIAEENGKHAYENPFAFPLAFVCRSTDFSDLAKEDPFQRTNDAYARLFGQPMAVYQPATFTEESLEDGRRRYTVPASRAGQLYGDIQTEIRDQALWDLTAMMTMDGARQGYFHWLTPSVFDLPSGRIGPHEIMLASERGLPAARACFYRVDEAVLQAASSLARSRAADVTLGQETASIRVAGHEGEKLFTSLPWDKGWHVVQNGRDVQPEKIAGTFMGFTLEEGDNEILLRYRLPGARKGALITWLALVATIFLFCYENRYREK